MLRSDGRSRGDAPFFQNKRGFLSTDYTDFTDFVLFRCEGCLFQNNERCANQNVLSGFYPQITQISQILFYFGAKGVFSKTTNGVTSRTCFGDFYPQITQISQILFYFDAKGVFFQNNERCASQNVLWGFLSTDYTDFTDFVYFDAKGVFSKTTNGVLARTCFGDFYPQITQILFCVIPNPGGLLSYQSRFSLRQQGILCLL